MRLRSLQLTNFRQHTDSRIDFDLGLTGIIGPNGSGKTTILEAIAWALYGTPAVRGTREGIRSLRAGPRASVKAELEFDLGGHRYRVVRGLSSAELYLDGSSAPIANSITGVSDMVQRRLGMTREEFFNTYFTGQKELAVMAAMGPTERGQFLSRVLGYERLRGAQTLIRDHRKLLIAEASGVRQMVADPEIVANMAGEAATRMHEARQRQAEVEASRVAVKRELDELMPRWEAAQRERDAMQAVVAELRIAEAEVATLMRDTARLEASLAEIATAATELARVGLELTPLPSLRAQLADLERLAREEGKRQTLVETARILGDELAKATARRDELESAPGLDADVRDELERRRGALADAQREFESAHTEWVRDQQEASTKIDQLKAEIRELKKQREQFVELGEHGICPTCARPLETHYRQVLDRLDEQIETVTANGQYYRSRVNQLKEMPGDVRLKDEARRAASDAALELERQVARADADAKELASVRAEIEAKEARLVSVRAEIARIPLGYDARRHDAIRRDVERLAPLESRAARLSATVERQAAVVAEQATVAEQLAGARVKVADASARRDALRHADSGFGELRGRYEQVVASLRVADMAALTAASDIAAAQTAIDAAEAAQRELARAQRQLAELDRAKRMHDELDRAYSDMRTDLNQQLRPEISEIASKYLADLTDGRYSELELNEGYDVTVLEEGIPKPVISGGEEDLANLVLRLAISQMIAERAGQPFSLLILDEVFGSLDESRRNNVVDLLRRLHDRFEQVIVITHIESVREGLDRLVTVRYDEETATSRVEQEVVSPGVADEAWREGAA